MVLAYSRSGSNTARITQSKRSKNTTKGLCGENIGNVLASALLRFDFVEKLPWPARNRLTVRSAAALTCEDQTQSAKTNYPDLDPQVNKRPPFPSLSDHHGKLQSRWTCNSGLPRCRKSIVWHNGLKYNIYQLDLSTKLCRWLPDFLVGRVIQVKIEGFLSPKVYQKAGVPQGPNLSPLLFLIYVNDMPNPSHHQTNKSQFADDAGQWAVSKNIDLAAEYLQRDLDKLARWCAKWRIKLNPEKTKVIIFSKSRFAIRAEPALSLYGDLLSYYPHIKFLGITFDKRMTFTKHFEEILERCNQKFHRLRILVNKKWGPSPKTISQIYKQCVRPIFEHGIVSTITVSETVITKIQRVQNSFIRLALRLLKYVSARLLHEASGLPRVKDTLISVGQNHLARMHANPLVEHTINSATTNIAWDKYKTPISSLNHQTNQLTLTTRWRKMRWHRSTSNYWPWKWWSGPYMDTFGTVLGLKSKANTATW